MKHINRILCLVMALLMLCTALPLTTFAATEETTQAADQKTEEKPQEEPEKVSLKYPDDIVMEYPDEYLAEKSYVVVPDVLEDYLTEEFLNDLAGNFAACRTRFSIEKYKIPESLLEDLRSFIWYEWPEMFHVYGLGFYISNGLLTDVSADYREYADTAAEFESCNAAMMDGANELLAGIEGNNALTDVEKALLLHDRLINWVAYDYDNYLNKTLPKSVYGAYGALGRQSAVCQGYAMAYMYLLKRVGIESDYCSSSAMNHGWNIVYIDGIPYHVDATWDDPVYDSLGQVLHNNFLLSTAALQETGHYGTFISTPTDTKYDNYYWKESNASFVLYNNELYYKDMSDYTIRKADGTVTTKILDVSEDLWPISEYSNHVASNHLAVGNGMLLFSRAKGIYALDPATGAVNLVYAPDLSASPYQCIYGFKFERGQFVYYVNNDFDHGDKQWDSQIFRYTFQQDTTKTYTVTFKNTEGAVLSQKTYFYGQMVIPPQLRKDPDENGQVERWDKEVTVCLGNQTYTKVVGRLKPYLVKYIDWDGTLLKTVWYDEGEGVVIPDLEPTKEADEVGSYYFVGWKQISGDRDYIISEDRVYQAQYSVDYKKYTVTFYDWVGAIWYQRDYYIGEEIEIPDPPVRHHGGGKVYIFTGWDKEVPATCQGEASFYPTYRVENQSFTVTFKNADGTVLSSKEYGYGDTVTPPADPHHPDKDDVIYTYVFIGWDKEIAPCTEDVVYTACYDTRMRLYTVTFENWNGEVLQTGQYAYGEPVFAPRDPEMPGNHMYRYVFVGWSETVDYCYGNKTYRAEYREEYVYYTVEFRGWDGTLLSSQKCIWEGPVVYPKTPERACDYYYNYTFVDWDKNVTPCYGHATYTAVYSQVAREYTVVFYHANGALRKTYHYGDVVIPPTEAEVAKPADKTYTYTFTGWYPEVTVCQENAIYNANYAETYIDYTVTFKNWDGTILSQKTYHYGDPVTTPTTPQRPETETHTYHFVCWDSMVTDCCGNEVYTAVFNMKPKTEEPEIVVKNGWVLDGGKWYFYKNDVKQTGWILDGGFWYYMNKEGVMQTGWIKSGNVWYYLKPSGNMATGWCKVGSVYYYFNASGAMKTGWLAEGGVWYYLKSSGAMATGWCKVGSVYYYFNASGAMKTGWLKEGNTWYYLKTSGAMATGSLKIGTKTYRFAASGACLNP